MTRRSASRGILYTAPPATGAGDETADSDELAVTRESTEPAASDD